MLLLKVNSKCGVFQCIYSGYKDIVCNELFLDNLFSGAKTKEVAACLSFALRTSQYGLNEFRMGCAFWYLGYSMTDLECSF